ncbi:MAG: hypothetical protein LBT05_11535 [Planctomycetaceae bacterium]|jgi:phosphate transport system protein|nr:hypothetical protein [Planctomycetaceae bacterium]
MSELVQRLDRLFLKLDHMALLVEQTLADSFYAVSSNTPEDADAVINADEAIDRREVEIERECIRLLALYQPAAIDLRRICFIIKVNNDLERIADLCSSLAKMSKILSEDAISIRTFPAFQKLSDEVADAYHQTIFLVSPRQHDAEKDLSATQKVELAKSIILRDTEQIDVTFREYLAEVFAGEGLFQGKIDALYALTSMGRTLERIGDLCTNIAEDAIFLATGEIVRHEPR